MGDTNYLGQAKEAMGWCDGGNGDAYFIAKAQALATIALVQAVQQQNAELRHIGGILANALIISPQGEPIPLADILFDIAESVQGPITWIPPF